MSLSDTIAKLKGVASEGKELFGVLKGLADNGKDARETDKKKLDALVDKLDENARKAARESRDEEIKRLTAQISDYDIVSTIPGLSKEARDNNKADRLAAVARRGRFKAQAGTDFGGILTKAMVAELETLLAEAKKDVKSKKKAAGFLQAALKITDLSLRIATKLAA